VLAHYIEPFRCEIATGPDQVVVAPRGELDMATIGALEQELRRQQQKGSPKLVLDLSGLSFMDSSGLHLVTRWSEAAARDGFAFEIVPGPPVVQRVFELAEMTDMLPFRKPE
jgi:anti-anti-sigma factor